MTTKKISYSEKLRDPRWQKKRLCVMQRDGFACRDCGDADSTLHVHHCHYEKGEPWQTDERFLLTLCADCHDHRGDIEHDLKSIFADALASTPVGALSAVIELHGSQAVDTFRLSAINSVGCFKNSKRNSEIAKWFERMRATQERSK